MKQTRIQPGRWFSRHKHLLSVTLLLSVALLLLWGRLLLKNVPRTARAKPDPPVATTTAETTKGYRKPAKSRGDTPDDEQVTQVVRTWARSLVLQATMRADAPMAMINDRAYRVGDSINGFTVTSVQPGRVTLRCEEIEIRLKVGE